MKKLKVVVLSLLLLICSCSPQKSVLEIGYSKYSYLVNYENGSLEIYENIGNHNNVLYKSIPVGSYNIIYSGSATYRGYLYQYGDYYILSVG